VQPIGKNSTRFRGHFYGFSKPNTETHNSIKIAALTGLTYAFAQSLESTAKKGMKQEDAEREVSVN